MKTTQKTSIPKDSPKIQKFIAKIIHNGMYILLMYCVKWTINWGFILVMFKDGIIINIIIRNYELVINILYIFISIHIIAASYHRIKKMEYGHQ